MSDLTGAKTSVKFTQGSSDENGLTHAMTALLAR